MTEGRPREYGADVSLIVLKMHEGSAYFCDAQTGKRVNEKDIPGKRGRVTVNVNQHTQLADESWNAIASRRAPSDAKYYVLLYNNFTRKGYTALIDYRAEDTD